MHNLADSIVRFLESRKIISPSPTDRDIYVYGFDIALYTLFSTLGLILIGALCGLFFEACFLIVVYYLNQSLGGGYHANSHSLCFLTMVIGIVTSFFLLTLPYPTYAQIIVTVISIVLLWQFPLVLHPNKAYLVKQAPQFVKRSRTLIAIEGCFALGLFIVPHPFQTLTPVFSIALFFSALSRMVAVTQHRKLVFRNHQSY